LSPNLISEGSPLDMKDVALRTSYGAGLRYELDPQEKTMIRLDLASGDKSFNIYRTLNEAF